MLFDEAVLYGRSMDEYRKMFLLSDNDLQSKIIGVGDGPASFNAEMRTAVHKIVSVDPIYASTADEIEKRFYSIFHPLMDQVRAASDDFIWTYFTSPEDLECRRIRIIRQFLSDYEPGKDEKRYVIGNLPYLPFCGGQFDIAICSHLLFLYSHILTMEFHLESILEMLRIAKEVRICPLHTTKLERSPYVEPVARKLGSLGYRVEVQPIDYIVHRCGSEILRISRDG